MFSISWIPNRSTLLLIFQNFILGIGFLEPSLFPRYNTSTNTLSVKPLRMVSKPFLDAHGALENGSPRGEECLEAPARESEFVSLSTCAFGNRAMVCVRPLSPRHTRIFPRTAWHHKSPSGRYEETPSLFIAQEKIRLLEVVAPNFSRVFLNWRDVCHWRFCLLCQRPSESRQSKHAIHCRINQNF